MERGIIKKTKEQVNSLSDTIIRELVFKDERAFEVESVLTNIKRWQAYSPEYLEKKVNENLSNFLSAELGEWVARLADEFDWSSGEVLVSGAGIRFPGGAYSASYTFTDKKKGILNTEIRLHHEFSELLKIPQIMQIINFIPRELKVELMEPLHPLQLVDKLRAKKWKIISQLPHCVQAQFLLLQFTVEPSSVSMSGFSMNEMFPVHDEQDSILSAIFGFLRT